MGLTKSSELTGLDRTVRAAFMDAYNSKSVQQRWKLYATAQPSTSAKNTYPMIVDAANVREWTDGERAVNGIVIEGASVTNQLWELTYGLRRIDLDDDMSGAVAMAVSRVKSGGNKYLRHKDKLAASVLKSNATCLDGLALFHASHKVNPADADSATYGNTTSGALTPSNAAACRAAMLEMKAADGEPANDGSEMVLLVPPALELTARKVAQADVVVFGSSGDANETNVYKGQYLVVVEPRLAAAFTSGSDSYWYMADVSDPEDRGVIIQEREAVEIVAQFNPSDPLAFTQDKYVWGTRARYTAAAGNPKKLFRRTG